MKAWMMVRVGVLVAALAGCLVLIGCDGLLSDGIRRSPVGHFEDGDETVNIGSGHTFRLEKIATPHDGRHYVISGTCAWTLEEVDEYNELANGHFDLTITGITLDGDPVSSIHPSNDYGDVFDATLQVGDTCPGWWVWATYSVTEDERLEINVNMPPKLREPSWRDSGDWSFEVGVPA